METHAFMARQSFWRHTGVLYSGVFRACVRNGKTARPVPTTQARAANNAVAEQVTV